MTAHQHIEPDGSAIAILRRAASTAARNRSLSHAAAMAAPVASPFVVTNSEPYSAKAWAAISAAYSHLASARLARIEGRNRQRLYFLAGAAEARRRAKTYRQMAARPSRSV